MEEIILFIKAILVLQGMVLHLMIFKNYRESKIAMFLNTIIQIAIFYRVVWGY
jgi:hypothetical protein